MQAMGGVRNYYVRNRQRSELQGHWCNRHACCLLGSGVNNCASGALSEQCRRKESKNWNISRCGYDTIMRPGMELGSNENNNWYKGQVRYAHAWSRRTIFVGYNDILP